MKKETAEKILKEIETGYDLVADKFSGTRKYFWRGLEFISGYAKDGDTVLDFGCGNGRLLELFPDKNIKYFGVDASGKLIEIAKQKYNLNDVSFQKISGSESLPFQDNYFNTVYSIAVFHHLPSQELRFEIAKEIHRILKPGGRIIVTVWNLWQMKYLKNILKNYINRLFFRSNLNWNDCWITFKDNQGSVFYRYHHAFTKGELKRLFSKTGLKIIKCDKINSRNIIIIGAK